MKQQKKWMYAFLATLITISLTGFGRMSYGYVMPFMMESLAISYKEAGVIATASSIGYLAMVLVIGLVANRFGLKRVVLFGLLLQASGFISLFFIQTYSAALISMIIIGVGTAFGYTPMVSIVVGWFPKNKGFMVGFLLSGAGLGSFITSLVMPLANHLYAEDGWRYVWLSFGLISFLILLISLRLLEEPPFMAEKEAMHAAKSSLFKEVYFHRGVLLIAIIYGLIGFANLIPPSFMLSYMLEENIIQWQASIIIGIGGLIGIVSGPILGAISDKLGREKTLLVATILSLLAVVTPVVLPNFFGFIAHQLLWGIAFMGIFSLVQVLSIEQTALRYAPIALAYTTAFFAFGQILGPAIAGYTIEYFKYIPSALYLCAGIFTLIFIITIVYERYQKTINER